MTFFVAFVFFVVVCFVLFCFVKLYIIVLVLPNIKMDLCWRTAPLSHTRASVRLQNVPRRPPRAKDEPRTPPRVLPVGSFFRCLLASRLPSRDQDRLMDRMNSEGVCNQTFSNNRHGRA